MPVRTPGKLLHLVWPLPRSLATTYGISVDVFSSPYLDVSVQAVPHVYLWIQYTLTGSSPAGLPHSEIPGSMLICSSPRLIAACHVFRRLLMPRHSPCALISLTSRRFDFRLRASRLTFSRFDLFLVLIVEKVLELCRLQIGYFVVCVTLRLLESFHN